MKQITLLFSALLFSISANAQSCLPTSSPWTSVDIGDVALAGASCYDSSQNSFEVTASGADIWGASDEFHYVYQELSGDGEIVARVDGLINTHPWAKAGVMMRNGSDADAAQILMSLSTNPINMGIAYSLQDRPSKGATMRDNLNNIGPVPIGSFPYYVRLVRDGNNFSGYASATNGDWTLVGTKTINMGETILVGLATTSHRDGTATMATYSEVAVEEVDSNDPTAFITTWKTDNPGITQNNQIRIPTFPGETYNFSVDWGDGSSNTVVTDSITHNYAVAGTYQISIRGNYPRIYYGDFGNAGDKRKLLSVDQWGDIQWSTMSGAFAYCNNVQILATDAPDLSQVTSLSNMFRHSHNINNDFSAWDFSTIKDMERMFYNAYSFNQDVSGWNTSNVTTMYGMFNGATAFNQDISGWDTGSVITMSEMFDNASAFNQNLSGWDTSNVIDMSRMFAAAETFNQDLSGWDTSSVNNMSRMFLGARDFNQDISGWDTRNVTTMNDMFNGAMAFNQNLSGWETSNVTAMYGMFLSAKAFNQDISGWNTSNVTSMWSMFKDASAFNQDISIWDTSSLTDMNQMFYNANSFDQDISDFDISSVTGMQLLFAYSGVSIDNYDSMLASWSEREGLTTNLTLGAEGINYCQGEEARQKLIDDFGWTITDGGKSTDCDTSQTPFITTWKTDNEGSSADNQITIPTYPGETYDYTVDWGDGTSDIGVTGDITHTYSVSGTYQVSISGDLPRIYFHNNVDSNYQPGPGDKDKIIEINQWGDIQWSSMRYAFYGCTNLDVLAVDIPNFTNLSSLSFMFADCSSLLGNSTFNNWNITNVNDLSFMFSRATLFNQDIGGWDTSNAIYMQSMFSFATLFNQPIGQWDVSNATSIDAMFLDAKNFNQDISSWQIVSTQLPNMFNGAESFNQDISNWDVSNITNFGASFANASSFNQNLADWNVSSAKVMNSMFLNATSFNQDIGGWNVDNAEEMNGMFAKASSFNQNLADWDVSSVRDMNNMFQNATSFNQDIGDWNVDNVEEMYGMFANATVFDQNLGTWNISNVSNMEEMFAGTGLSSVNYDALLTGWGNLPSVQAFTTFDAGSSQYCAGVVGRRKLVDDFGWIISDGGLLDGCDSSGSCTTLPSTWTGADIGDVAVTGTSCYNGIQDTFEVTASGADIWGTNDEFHYVYQELIGDGEIIAKVEGLTNTHPWAKAGVMMRSSTDSDAAQILMSLSTNPVNVGIGYSLQDRPSKGAAMRSNSNNIGPVPVGSFPYYVRLVREGDNFTGYASATNGNWTLVGTKAITMNETILVGLATTSHRHGSLTTANYGEVSIQRGTDPVENNLPKIFLEGNEVVRLFTGDPYIEQGATALDIEDGDISDFIITNSTVDNAIAGFYEVLYSVTDSDGGTATKIRYVLVEPGPDSTSPVVTLIGSNYITLIVGEEYTELGATAIDDVDGNLTQDIIIDTSDLDISNPGTSYVTYNVTDSSGNEAIERVRRVDVVPESPCLPLPWRNTDIGDVAINGTACYGASENSFEVTASGADIWGTNDEFHYVYQRLSGDGEIVARVDGLTNTHPWAKAGVMMRNSVDSDAAQILMSLSTNPVNVGIGYSLQDRPSKGASMREGQNNIGPVPVGNFPYYVRLVREGNNFSGYASASNGNWTLVGTKTIAMDATILVGLATTSHRDGVITTANYADVFVHGSTSAAKPGNSRAVEGNTENQFQRVTNATVARQNLMEMSTYPNPSSETVTISFGRVLIISEFQIYDVTGRMVGHQNVNTIENGAEYQLDVRTYDTGTYFLRAKDEMGRVYQKQLLIKH